jgi:predicted N-acetyltransferase YhbS
MNFPAFLIRTQTPCDRAAVEALHEHAFGPGRFARTAYRVREGCIGEPRLSLCAMNGAEMIGAIEFTPITIGGAGNALLLGPLVIADAHKNNGWGLKLMLDGMSRAIGLGYRFVILVGDLPYYARAGFAAVPRGQIEMPGPVNPDRLLCAELEAGCLPQYRGRVAGIALSPPEAEQGR